MIELALLAMFSRGMTWGLGPVIAERTVAADIGALRDLLSDPATQKELIAGATGLHPGVRVTVVTPRVLKSELRLRGTTVAWVTWILTGARGTTNVDLALQLESRGIAARLVGLLGGRWIARRLEAALATLATASARTAEAMLVLPGEAAARPPARRRKKTPGHDAKHAALHR